MAEHTPGPWRVFPLYVLEDGRFSVEVRTDVHYAPVKDIEANARLIAAAPELLAALTDLHRAAVDAIDAIPSPSMVRKHLIQTVDAAQEVLAKARGSTDD